ncbi:MAG: leucine-rich repeat domain-containing protein [Saprospiraceae bacterium]|nr:leucine-rich repeat domain-containing protein [Saprospiraceae bacterium]MCF8251150.1 leucine-rich repeat domain-containing protein [Saprospiraceae bacterium]MCF8281873.1 leucine-rich repeat domain-containing protein [Bacteroidales bacterium]MCF8312962.1 leucine-rich repeat domain-containing protein [Saprospiraceae bacterium]MCF8441409.1 leucine-rich repeat domain-containing protein [Saprospiraceae bacterium]
MSDLAKQRIEEEKIERTGHLNLGKCGLTNFPDLSELHWLETLIITDDLIIPVRPRIVHPLPKGLKSLTIGDPLQWVDDRDEWCQLKYGQINNWQFLEKLNHLEVLKIRAYQFSDDYSFESLTSLQDLQLSFVSFTGSRYFGEHLANLKNLDLSCNYISDLRFLKNMTGLISLNLYYNQITDAPILESLTNLESLDLRLNNITDWQFLEKLINLKSLRLTSYQISDEPIFNALKERGVIAS